MMKISFFLFLMCAYLICSAAPAKKAPTPKAAAEAAPKAAAPEKKAPVPQAPPAPAPRRNTTVDFRGGKVLCAEISSTRPAIRGFDEKNFRDLPAQRLYAALTVLCDADRALSIHDYCLDHYGVFPCVAIREDNGAFISSTDAVIRVNPKKKYTLLFIIDAAVAGSDEEICSIKAACDNGPFSKQQIPFKIIKNKPFTAPGRIPVTGLIPERI